MVYVDECLLLRIYSVVCCLCQYTCTDFLLSFPDFCMKCKKDPEDNSGLFNWCGHGGAMCTGPQIMSWR